MKYLFKVASLHCLTNDTKIYSSNIHEDEEKNFLFPNFPIAKKKNDAYYPTKKVDVVLKKANKITDLDPAKLLPIN